MILIPVSVKRYGSCQYLSMASCPMRGKAEKKSLFGTEGLGKTKHWKHWQPTEPSGIHSLALSHHCFPYYSKDSLSIKNTKQQKRSSSWWNALLGGFRSAAVFLWNTSFCLTGLVLSSHWWTFKIYLLWTLRPTVSLPFLSSYLFVSPSKFLSPLLSPDSCCGSHRSDSALQPCPKALAILNLSLKSRPYSKLSSLSPECLLGVSTHHIQSPVFSSSSQTAPLMSSS